MGRVTVNIGNRPVAGELTRTTLPDSTVTVVLVGHDRYFGRPGLYTENGRDYPDNCERFVFFCRAALEAIKALGLIPDIIHANDWQTGLIPAVFNAEYRSESEFRKTACVFTIHNLAFQGSFPPSFMDLTNLPSRMFNWQELEFYGALNLLKAGIVFSEVVSTVSPTYAREICQPEHGCGLEGVLSSRGRDLIGILNGVDMDIWNPSKDPFIEARYSVDSVKTGKARCKAALQESLGMPVSGELMVVGMVSRMTDQKGFDLISANAKMLLKNGVQLVFLGTGDERHEEATLALEREHPKAVATRIGFDEAVAHQIEAGADAYLMPSRYEPCGLNQQYSMVYGTLPIVHAVGGLADAVIDESTPDGSGTGFCFDRYTSAAFVSTFERAVSAYRDSDRWSRLVKNGMARDWSWSRSAAEYIAAYDRALDNRRRS